MASGKCAMILRGLRIVAAAVFSLLLAGMLLPVFSDRQQHIAALPALAICVVLALPLLLIVGNVGKNRRLECTGWAIQLLVLALALS